MQSALTPEIFRKLYRDFADQNPKWNEISSSTGDVYQWDDASDYIQEPPFFADFSMEPGKIEEIRDARPLGIFGDSVTTDHISPAGAIKANSPAGKYLQERGIKPEDFNSYGSPPRQRPRHDPRHLRQRPDQEPDGPRRRRRRHEVISPTASRCRSSTRR